MKNTLYILLLLCIFYGCSKKPDDSTKSSTDTVELTFWTSTNPEEIDFAKSCVAEWDTLHPEIKIKMQPLPEGKSTEEVLMAAIAGKTTPDIIANIWPGAVVEFVAMGGMVPVDTFPDFDQYISERVPEKILNSFYSKDNHIYQVPWKGNPIMMQYNVKMFREAGYETPPRTYSEFLDAAGKITKDLDGDGQIDQWMGFRDIVPLWYHRLSDFYPLYINASHGLTLFTKDGEINFENDAAIEAFAFMQKLYNRGYFPRTTFQGDALLRRKVAVQFTGPWNIAHTEKYKDPDFEYSYSHLPVPDDFQGEIMTYGDYKNIAIFSTCEHPDEAWEFIKFLISKENDLKFLQICNQIPLRKDMTEDEFFKNYFDKNPLMRKFAEQAQNTRDVDSLPEIVEIFDAISSAYEECVIYGLKSPEQAIKDAVKRVKVILYQF